MPIPKGRTPPSRNAFRALRDPDVHAAILRTVAPLVPWLDALEPITGVFQMAGLHNTLRRLVVDGEPVVTGLSAVGDSVCTTNPTLGRGLALALWGAADLVAALDEGGDSCVEQALALDGCVGEHVAPFYEDQARIDEARLAMLRHAILGEPAPPAPPPISDRVTYSQLRTAAMYDPTAFRGLWNIQGMIRKPSEVYSYLDVVAATRDTLAGVDAQPVPQPTPTQLLDALKAQPPPCRRSRDCSSSRAGTGAVASASSGRSDPMDGCRDVSVSRT